jgi:hypothetical protein
MTSPQPGRRREAATVLAVVAACSVAVVFTAGRIWLNLVGARPAPFAAVQSDVTGRAEFAALSGLAVVVLVTALLVFVSGGWARIALGLLIAIAGGSISYLAANGVGAPSQLRQLELLGSQSAGVTGVRAQVHNLWPVSTLILGLMMSAAGLVVVFRSRAWPGLSKRYEGPSQTAEPADLWRTLDRGEDPTTDSG